VFSLHFFFLFFRFFETGQRTKTRIGGKDKLYLEEIEAKS